MGKCYNSTVVDAPIDNVWKMINNFHDMSWGNPVISKLDIVGETPGSEVGAKRVLNDAFHETLLSIDAEKFTFSYSIDDGPDPLGSESDLNYVGEVCLYPVTDSGQTLVVWSSSYESESDSAVSEFCNPIYIGLLSCLKAQF